VLFKCTVNSSLAQTTPIQVEEDTTLVFGIFHEMETFDRMIHKAEKKDSKLLLYFTGYGDINGRKMETVFFESAQIQILLKNDFICFIGYTDDRISLTTESSMELGISPSFKTKGQYLKELQTNLIDTTYKSVFIAIDWNQSILDTFGYSLDTDKFIEFLKRNK
jgi:thiol:disulfide interchange protein DsbD